MTWANVPFWSEFQRVKRPAIGDEELLSVYRDHGVVRKADRDDNFNKPSDDLSSYQRVRVGDLVINKMKAWQGSVSVSRLDGIVSPAYFVFRATGRGNSAFLHYLLRSDGYVARYRVMSKGIRPNQWDLDPDALRTLEVRLPDAATQQAIADYLDRETAQIDAFIADQSELVALLTERQTATVTAAFAAVVDIRAEWASGGIRVGEYFRESNARVGDVPRLLLSVSIHRGVVPWDEINEAEPAADSHHHYKVVDSGDVVLNKMRAFQGAVGFATTDGMASPDYAVLVPHPTVVETYWSYLMRSTPFSEAMSARLRGIGGTGTGVVRTPRINVADLFRIRVRLPSLAEQHLIATQLDHEIQEIDQAIADSRDAIALSQERRRALISAAVTGKIDMEAR